MKRKLPHYLVLAELESADLARMIGLSTERIANWLRRGTPIYVSFDFDSMEIEKVTNESTVWYAKSNTDT